VSDAWKDRHPGGKLVLDHMIGRDATDEIDAWVYTSSPIPASLKLRGR
jgi:delta8-fatty-acid desaturase